MFPYRKAYEIYGPVTKKQDMQKNIATKRQKHPLKKWVFYMELKGLMAAPLAWALLRVQPCSLGNPRHSQSLDRPALLAHGSVPRSFRNSYLQVQGCVEMERCNYGLNGIERCGNFGQNLLCHSRYSYGIYKAT